MISFRKFVMVGAMLAVFAGLAAAQTIQSVSIMPATYPTLRAEGLTEALPDLTFNVSVGALDPAPAAGSTATYDITILANGGAPFTSPADKILVNGNPNANITVSGALVRIPGVVFTFPGLVQTASATVTGLRIDAYALSANAFASIQATAFPTALVPKNGVTLTAVGSSSTNVAVVMTSLTTTISANTSDKLIKSSTTSGAWTSTDLVNGDFDPTNTDPAMLTQAPLFTTTFAAAYAGAFWTVPPAENKLRFTFTVTNIPAGLALYVPQKVGTLTLVLGTDSTGANGYLAPATLAAYAVPANGMVVYEVEVDDGSKISYTIPVYSVGTTPLALTSGTAPFTYNGGYAPLSTDLSAKDTSPILRFAANSVTEFDSFLVVTLPSSHFAFPYLVNGNGWVTGIAIINGGAGFGSAANPTKGNAGTCKLTFYSADGTLVAPAAVTVPLASAATATIVPGGNYGFTLDQALGTGTAYAGIVYGACNFDHVKAFGYLNGDGTTAAYLAQ
jgi:hypothetical protein